MSERAPSPAERKPISSVFLTAQSAHLDEDERSALDGAVRECPLRVGGMVESSFVVEPRVWDASRGVVEEVVATLHSDQRTTVAVRVRWLDEAGKPSRDTEYLPAHYLRAIEGGAS